MNIVFISLFFLLFINTLSGEQISISIFGFTKSNISSDRTIKALSNMIEKEINKLDSYSIKKQNEINQNIKNDKPGLIDCNLECLSQFGNQLNIDLLIIGHIKKSERTHIADIEFFNVNNSFIQKKIHVKSKKGFSKFMVKVTNEIILELSDKSYLNEKNSLISGIINKSFNQSIKSDFENTDILPDQNQRKKNKTKILNFNENVPKSSKQNFFKIVADENGGLYEKNKIKDDKEKLINKNNPGSILTSLGTINGEIWSKSVPPIPGQISNEDILIEEISLLATEYQDFESSNLVEGKEYYLKITGTYGYGGWSSPQCIDGSFAHCGHSEGNIHVRIWTWNGLDTQLPYPDIYNSSHTYYYYFTSDGTSQNFGFFDGGGYDDNSGGLNIEIWERSFEKDTDLNGEIEKNNTKLIKIDKNELINKNNSKIKYDRTNYLVEKEDKFGGIQKYFGNSEKKEFSKPLISFDYQKTTHPIRYELIDNYAENIVSKINEPIYLLTDKIIKKSENEYEKIRSIYKWITKNISYDIESLKANTITHDKVKPINVLKTRKTVCSGYANLFKEMAVHAKIETEVISGYAKGYGYKPGDLLKETNHAWNTISINDKKYLIDCTWGSGYIDEKDNFVSKYTEYYFLVKPEHLIWTHLPEKSNFQLIKNKITKNEFELLPQVRRSFFDNKINFIGNHKVGYVLKEELSLDFKISEDTKIMSSLEDAITGEKHEGFIFTSNYNDTTNIRIKPPFEGEFYLNIFSKNYKELDSYSSSVKYLIKVNENYKENFGFVKTWNDNLKKYKVSFEETHSFIYNISDMLILDYICPDDVIFTATLKDLTKKDKKENCTFLQRSESGIRLMVNVPDDKNYLLTVFAKNKNDQGSFTAIAEYKITSNSNNIEYIKSFPMQYSIFNDKDGNLLSPLEGNLKINKNYIFSLEFDNTFDIQLIYNEKWTKFQKNDSNQFILNQIFDKKGMVKIVGKGKNDEKFTTILEYSVGT